MTRGAWAVACAVVALGLVLGLAWRGRAAGARAVPEASAHVSYAPDATIKDVMSVIVDPSATVLWDSVSASSGKDGVDEKAPTSDADWTRVRQGAIRLVEASNLLLIPGRHVARPGEKSATPGVELEPAEMEALVTKDPAGWSDRVHAFRTVGLEMLKAADARDANGLFEAGDRLDTACENCHRQYWYPNEKIPDLPSCGAATPTQGSSR